MNPKKIIGFNTLLLSIGLFVTMDQIIIQKQLNPPKAGALHLPYILQFSSCFLHSGVNLVTAPWLYNLVGT